MTPSLVKATLSRIPLTLRGTINSEPDSCWVAPRSDKGRYFSTFSASFQNEKVAREGDQLSTAAKKYAPALGHRLTSGETAEALTDAEAPTPAPAFPAQQQKPKPTEVAPANPEQTIPTKRPMLVGHLPPHVEMAYEALKQEGLRPVGDVTEIGNHAYIECLLPADTENQSSNHGVAGRANHALRSCGIHPDPKHVKIIEVGAGRVLVQVRVRLGPERDYEPRTEMLPLRRGGRPRNDSERERVTELRMEGKSWTQIAKTVNQETDQKKSKEAYRALLRSPKTK